MENSTNVGGHEPSPVSVRTANGRAEFRRTGVTAANLTLEYEVTGIDAAIQDASDAALRQAVDDACRKEIDQMRAALWTLGNALGEQLDKEGSAPDIDLKTDDDDRRTWIDRRTQLVIDPSDYRSETHFNGYRGASDAHLVRKTVEVTIRHRERHIRDLYDKILAGVADKRAGALGMPAGRR